MKKIFIIFIIAITFIGMPACHALSNDYLLPKAHNEFNNKQYKQSVETLTSIIETSPNNEEALYLRAKAEFRMNELQNAIDDMEKSIKIKETYEKNAFLARLYARTNNVNNAKKVVQLLVPIKNTSIGDVRKGIDSIIDDNKLSDEMKETLYVYIVSASAYWFELFLDVQPPFALGILKDIMFLNYAKWIQFISNLDKDSEVFKEAQQAKNTVNNSLKQKNIFQADILLGLSYIAEGQIAKGDEIIEGTYYNASKDEKLAIPKSTVDNIKRILKEKAPKYGVGIQFEKINKSIYVKEVMSNSPAAAAGLKPGMKILRIQKAGEYVYGDEYIDKYKNINSMLSSLTGNYNDIITIEVIEYGKKKSIGNELLSTLVAIDTSDKPKNYTMRCTQKVIFNGNFDEDDFSFSYKSNENKYGIGIAFNIEGDYPVIKTILSGTPASYTNKIEVGDKIIEVNNVSTKGMNRQEVANLIIGPANSTVNIKIRKNQKDYVLNLKRGF